MLFSQFHCHGRAWNLDQFVLVHWVFSTGLVTVYNYIKNVDVEILRFNFGYDHHDYIKIVKITLQLASMNILAYSVVCTLLFALYSPLSYTPIR